MAEGRVEGLCWRYCQGLRMAGAPAYTRGHRILPLPGTRHWDRPSSWEAQLAQSLRRLVALCGGQIQQCPHPRTLRTRSLLEWATDCLPEHQVWLQESRDPHTVLDLAREAIHAGGLALLYCQPERHSPRWMLVVGVEQIWQSDDWGSVSALLVLDPGTPLVWNCGHNLQLVPAVESAQETRAEVAHAAWNLRTLDGGLCCGMGHAALLCHPLPDPSDASVNPMRPCSFI